MNEREVKARIRNTLRRHHWFVVDFASHKTVGKQIRDWPDLYAIRWGYVQHLECKGSTGKPTQGQLEWRNKFMPHSGPYARHMFVYPWTELKELALWGECHKPHGFDYKERDDFD